MILDQISLRALGSLMEKEMTTPETYPLSLNSLVAAANQKTSREPVLQLTEEELRGALDILQAHELVTVSHDARVPKYEHRARTVLNLRRDETAVLCLLLLRGAQTAGELRSRADRMFSFEDLAAVQTTLDRLAARQEPLVRALGRSAGEREGRWTHLLTDPSTVPINRPERPEGYSGLDDELGQLRQTVAELERRVRAMETRLEQS
jgi:uncharacterized protein YceH (UPF0502 family)